MKPALHCLCNIILDNRDAQSVELPGDGSYMCINDETYGGNETRTLKKQKQDRVEE